jgi:hypothetical protein
MDWGSIVGNVASGGLLGLLGSAFSAGLSIWQAREQRAANREKAEAELKRLELQGRLDLQKATAEIQATEAKALASGFDASQAADANAHGASDWVQDFKALTRHVVVYLLIVLTAVIYFYATPEVQSMIAGTTVQATFAAIFWLYGQRQILQGTNYITTFK